MKEHTIEMIVFASNATLRIVDKFEKRSLIQQSGRHLQISGDEPIYVGGVPNSMRDRISSQLGHVKNGSSFYGCLTSLHVNSREIDLANDLDYSHKIVPGCDLKSACRAVSSVSNSHDDYSSSPCMNGGTCVDKLTLAAEYFCECPREFTGSLCETPLKLSGSGLNYRALINPNIR